MPNTDLFADPDVGAPERRRQERNDELPPFFKMADLVGRHVIIDPEKIETVPDGKYGPYEKLTAKVVIVLDGRENEIFPRGSLPRIQRNTWIFDADVVLELHKFLDPKNEDFGKKAVGYVNVNDRKRIVLEKPDPGIYPQAEAAWQSYESGQVPGQEEEPPF